jgi:hypothetical protein
LSKFHFTLVHKPGSYNKADALSWHSDLKKGIHSDESKDHVLLTDKIFAICTAQPITINSHNNPLQKQIKGAQTYNAEVSQALESILKNGPQSIIKGLKD